MRPSCIYGVLAIGAIALLALVGAPAASATTVEATVLCAEEPNASNECEGEAESYGPGSTITASSSEAVFTLHEASGGSDDKVKCHSKLEGESIEDTDESPLHAATVSSVSFSECKDNLLGEHSCTVKALNLPYGAQFLREDAKHGNGHAYLYGSSAEKKAGVSILCEGGVTVNCTYAVSETNSEVNGGATKLAALTVNGGSKPTMVASSVSLEEVSGTCPGSTPVLGATYAVEAPTPMFVAKLVLEVKVSPALSFKLDETKDVAIENPGTTGWFLAGVPIFGPYGFTDPNKCVSNPIEGGKKCTVKVKCLEAKAGSLSVMMFVGVPYASDLVKFGMTCSA